MHQEEKQQTKKSCAREHQSFTEHAVAAEMKHGQRVRDSLMPTSVLMVSLKLSAWMLLFLKKKKKKCQGNQILKESLVGKPQGQISQKALSALTGNF